MEEEKIYRLGNYEFETLREYRQAQEDLKKIKYITDELDINDPEVALRLYNLMRNKQIRFKSELGKSFFWAISDIVAENSKSKVSDDRKTPVDGAMKPLLETRWQKIVGIACIVVAVISLGYYGFLELQEYNSARKLEKLQENRPVVNEMAHYENTEEETEPQQESTPPNHFQEELTEPPEVLEEYKSYYEQNPDMVGWIKIEGTNIDYPVMQSSTEEYEYYLKHSFNKEEDKNGTPFVDARNNIWNRDTNLVIYGHNMRSGLMFGTLKNYLEEDFRLEHPTIQFDTIYEKANYQVIGVCLAKVEYQDETVFRYYNFLNAENEIEFNDYIAQIQQMEVLGLNLNTTYGDELLTLSTCNSYIEDGRMFVIAKKIK